MNLLRNRYAECENDDAHFRLAMIPAPFYNPRVLTGSRSAADNGFWSVFLMADGFLGFRTSFMLDFVVCALAAIVPILVYSIYLVKFKAKYVVHRYIQLGLAVVLLIAVGAFEVDMQLVQGGWENVVAKREIPLSPEQLQSVRYVLWIHLVFAVSSPILWAVTIVLALRRMPQPPAPCDHSPLHKKLGWASTIDLTLTSITGLWFYFVAFVQ